MTMLMILMMIMIIRMIAVLLVLALWSWPLGPGSLVLAPWSGLFARCWLPATGPVLGGDDFD